MPERHSDLHRSLENGTFKRVSVPSCRNCGYDPEVTVTISSYLKWMGGTLIQDAMPDLSVECRELFISRFCSSCFDEITA